MADITSAIDFLKKIKEEDFVTVKFTKQDGTERIMKCTLNFDKIPQEQRPKKVDLIQVLNLIQNNGILHVFDLEKNAWRSVPFEKVEWLETQLGRFAIKIGKGMLAGKEFLKALLK